MKKNYAMKTIISILLSGISMLAFGQPGADHGAGKQQLVGVWQEGSATVGDLDSSGLYLIMEYRKEIVGGTFEKGNPGVES